METPVAPEVFAAYPGVDFSVPATVIKPVHSAKNAPAPRMRIGEALLAAGVLTEDQLTQCLAEQKRLGQGGAQDRRLGAIVVSRGLASEGDIAEGLAAITGFARVDPADLEARPAVVRLVPRALAAALRIIPLEAGPTWIRVAAADPFDRRAIDAVRDATGRTSVTLAIATTASVLLALEEAWDPALDELAELTPVAPAAAAQPRTSTATGARPASSEPDARPDSGLTPLGDRGPLWEYCHVGEDLPSAHPGYTPDLARLEARLAVLGGQGWDAVGLIPGSRGTRVLLKRPVFRAR